MQLTDAIHSSISHGGFTASSLLDSPPLPSCLDLIDAKPLKKKRILKLRTLVKEESGSEHLLPELSDLIRKYLLLTASVESEKKYFLKDFVKSAYRHARSDEELAHQWFERGYLHRLYSFSLEGIKKASFREEDPSFLVMLSHSHGYSSDICELIAQNTSSKEEKISWLARGYSHQAHSFDALLAMLSIGRDPKSGTLIFPSSLHEESSLPHLIYAFHRNTLASEEALSISKEISQSLSDNPCLSLGSSSRWYERALGREAIAYDLGRAIPSHLLSRKMRKMLSNMDPLSTIH